MMAARMTWASYRRGLTNAAICSLGMAAIYALTTWGLVRFFSLSRIEAFIWSIGLVWLVCWVAFLAGWLKTRMAGQPVLLDCGRHPWWWLFLVEGAVFLVFGLVGTNVLPAGPLRVGGVLFGLTGAIFWVILATGRLQVRQDGVWQYWALLPWGKLASYSWSPDATLLLRARASLPLLGRGALPVPPELRDEFDKLLQKRSGVDPDLA